MRFGTLPDMDLLNALKALVPEGQMSVRHPVRLRTGSARPLGDEIHWVPWETRDLFIQLGRDVIYLKPRKKVLDRRDSLPVFLSVGGADFHAQLDVHPDFPSCWAVEDSDGRGYFLQIDLGFGE